jgi:hypothetical protein
LIAKRIDAWSDDARFRVTGLDLERGSLGRVRPTARSRWRAPTSSTGVGAASPSPQRRNALARPSRTDDQSALGTDHVRTLDLASLAETNGYARTRSCFANSEPQQ